MGNMLARTQLRAIFSQLLTRVPDLSVGEPEMLRSNFVHAVKTHALLDRGVARPGHATVVERGEHDVVQPSGRHGPRVAGRVP